MATLTYDSSEAPEGELTAEEQDSLQVGEQLLEQQDNLLAGKYQNAEELEGAYLELQQKLGNSDTEETEYEQEESEEVDSTFLDRLWAEAQDEYTQETLDELQEMDSADLAQMFLNYKANQQDQYEDLSDVDVNELHNVVGGEENYGEMLGWAQQNLSDGDIRMYDEVMDRGDPLACFFAVQALAARYSYTEGYEGEMLTGSASRSTSDSFRSQAEVVRAMNDPRYENDPAYRADVYNKLERSPELNF